MKNKRIIAIALSLTIIASLPGVNTIAAPIVNTNNEVTELVDTNEDLTTDNSSEEVNNDLEKNENENHKIRYKKRFAPNVRR